MRLLCMSASLLLLAGCAFKASQGVTVPDHAVAVSSTHLALAQNFVFRSWNLNALGDPPWTSAAFNAMGGCLEQDVGSSGFDPRLQWDPSANAWYYVALDRGLYWCLGVIYGPDPSTAPRRAFKIPVAPNEVQGFPDYPSLGFSDDKLILTSGNFGQSYAVVNKADVLAQVAPRVTMFSVDNDYLIRAVHNIDGTGDFAYVVSLNNARDHMRISRISGVPGVTAVNRTTASVPLQATCDRAPDGDQPGTARDLSILGSTIQDAVFDRDNTLWVASQIECTAGLPGRGCVHLSEFLFLRSVPFNPARRQEIQVGAPTQDFFYPAIALDQSSNLLVGFGQSGSARFPSLMVTGRVTTDPLNTIRGPYTLKDGEGTFENGVGPGLNRWGDYFSVAVNPNDRRYAMVAGQYALNPPVNWWGTWLSTVGVGCDPVARTCP